ncbi:MAG: HAMP domain-containing sensor histidine kinase [Candidatus Delongbacteria bacterium]
MSQLITPDLLDSLPIRIYLVDREHRARGLDGRELETPGAVHDSDCRLCTALTEQCPIRLSLADGRRRHLELPPHMCGGEHYLELDILPLKGPEGGVLVLERELDLQDLELSRTDAGLERQIRQLDILNQVLAALQQSRDLDRILRIILAGLTFGKGLEFNRAFFFERQGDEIVGRLAVGPLSGEEAARIWNRGDLTDLSLGELFQNLGPEEDDRPIQRRVESIRFHLLAAAPQLRAALDRPGCTCLRVPELREPGSLCLLDLTGSSESWLAPVRVPASPGREAEETRGFLLVDNAITNRPPTSDHLDALVSCARHLGFALERARMNQELDHRLEELQEAYQQLDRGQELLLKSEKMAAVGRVTGNLAHEIKTPLMSIGGFARLLVRELEGQEKPRSHADLVLRECKRIERILEALMDYGAPQILRRDRLDLRERLLQLRDRLEDAFRERGIQLSVDTPAEPCWVWGDVLRLDQMLHAQVQNVLDLNEVRRDGVRRCSLLSISLRLEAEGLSISVADDGPGVPVTLLDTLFEPFVSGRDGALGLGLAQARDIARLHEGELRLLQPGRLGGAEFITTLHGRNHGQDPVRG